MYAKNLSPRHAGVAVVRAGVLQSRRTQVHTGSNLVSFDSGGLHLDGYSNESTEFGLRRIDVVADGLIETRVISTSPDSTTPAVITSSSQGILVGSRMYRAIDFSVIGIVSGGARNCRMVEATTKLVCLPHFLATERRLFVVDSSTFVTVANPVYSLDMSGDGPYEVVPSPAGIVALRKRVVPTSVLYGGGLKSEVQHLIA